eukprot:GSA25T00010144001.1
MVFEEAPEVVNRGKLAGTYFPDPAAPASVGGSQSSAGSSATASVSASKSSTSTSSSPPSSGDTTATEAFGAFGALSRTSPSTTMIDVNQVSPPSAHEDLTEEEFEQTIALARKLVVGPRYSYHIARGGYARLKENEAEQEVERKMRLQREDFIRRKSTR